MKFLFFLSGGSWSAVIGSCWFSSNSLDPLFPPFVSGFRLASLHMLPSSCAPISVLVISRCQGCFRSYY